MDKGASTTLSPPSRTRAGRVPFFNVPVYHRRPTLRHGSVWRSLPPPHLPHHDVTKERCRNGPDRRYAVTPLTLGTCWDTPIDVKQSRAPGSGRSATRWLRPIGAKLRLGRGGAGRARGGGTGGAARVRNTPHQGHRRHALPPSMLP